MVQLHFSPLKSGQPLYSGQYGMSQCVLCEEVQCIHVICIVFEKAFVGMCIRYNRVCSY